ncbi:MAG: hypothetical protein C5B59_09310, partial [Bacteroidetes bacterium]
LVDAQDLKSCDQKWLYGFNSRPGYLSPNGAFDLTKLRQSTKDAPMHFCKVKRIFLFAILIIGCTKSQNSGYKGPPLLSTAPWLLRYTDTLAISGSGYKVVRIPASGCARTDTIRFLPFNIATIKSDSNYVVTGSCGLPVHGIWLSSPDSLSSFGLPSDTTGLLPGYAKIELLTKDSMTLTQRSSFRNPDSLFANFVTMRYSH